MNGPVLVFGATGKLGSAMARTFRAAGSQVIGLGSAAVDARDPAAVAAALEQHRPSLVVNAAAMLGIDPCENDPAAAFRLNALFPGQVAGWASHQGIPLVHISTDAVFPDGAGDGFDEDAAARPINVYGTSKYAGDCLVLAASPRHLVCRISLQFGSIAGAPRQFVERMLQRMRAGEPELRIAADIICNPSYSDDVAQRVVELAQSGASGLFHVANAGHASLHELVLAMRDEFGLSTSVLSARASDFPGLGRKNRTSHLASIRTPPLRSWREALRAWCRDPSAAGCPSTT